ncbi:site-2 protease family protein [Mechercharimyces sp. CAU 1602]|uniref:site-2 protease family protein n=1 Tax=Mechercharimyces sp. CAU 1602 TaxID=2973933 RepID=UPI00216359F9|nr:site-2 protease family protein [Mechercharimyces sp. CAU 1602]MCS1352472.1 site-2 protease family protein [Mechercharimyces sp. CAU 1602]
MSDSSEEKESRGWRMLKPGNYGGTLLSMVVSVLAFSILLPWSFAVGLVLMIFIHEMGHVYAARLRGIAVSAPAFIPFLGALIMMREEPRDAEEEAFIALGGPLLGTVGAICCLLLAWLTGWTGLYTVAVIGFWINLFNLLPIHPLDGGRIVVAISRWLWVIGMLAGFALIVFTWSWILLIIWLIFVYQFYRAYLKKPEEVRSYQMEIGVEADRFLSAGMPIPGEQHERELELHQYCTVEDKEAHLKFKYPGIGEIYHDQKQKGVFLWARLVGSSKRTDEKGEPYIIMKIKGKYQVAPGEGGLKKEATYYQVELWVRFLYGAVYLGLAFFLLFMIYHVSQFALLSPYVVS